MKTSSDEIIDLENCPVPTKKGKNHGSGTKSIKKADQINGDGTELEKKICMAVEANQCLWKKNNRDFRNMRAREKAWAKIAQDNEIKSMLT